MELKAVESSRIVFLTTIHRPAGAMFLPASLIGLTARYHFQKVPSTEQLFESTHTLQMGVFQGAAIHEMSIYPDGVVVTSGSSTDHLDAFLSDLFSWAEEELGVRETGIPPREKHYESNIVVHMEINAQSIAPKALPIQKYLAETQRKYGLRDFDFDLGGISIAVDTTRYAGRKPTPFTLARRINVPFEANIFHSSAPLKTEDHLALLRHFEATLT